MKDPVHMEPVLEWVRPPSIMECHSDMSDSKGAPAARAEDMLARKGAASCVTVVPLVVNVVGWRWYFKFPLPTLVVGSAEGVGETMTV